ncbi:MAG TPA: hypothetical protein VEB42_04190, partial [Chitinophagaceae bacterium]|nr:hypothetical protein [Chitinophagaceae bacterium]
MPPDTSNTQTTSAVAGNGGKHYLPGLERMESLTAENFAELAAASADAGTFYIDIYTDHIVYSPSLARIMTGADKVGFTRL